MYMFKVITWVFKTFIVNVQSTVKEKTIIYSSLPTVEKANIQLGHNLLNSTFKNVIF